MTLHLSIVLFIPLAFGVVGLMLPERAAAKVALLGTLLVAAYA
ncbi:MAG: hypothetical protein QOD69_3083, partial [Solirubrobacteraceae bacterium]|nr:hypothetical protein [Solirubrobacteraceae bacterium]